MSYERIIFGDNQFLGVNHASQSKAIQLSRKFDQTEAIINVIAYAYESGIKDFMFTSHQKYSEVFSEICRSNLFPGMYYTPCIPYANKYWDELSNKGLLGLINSTIFKTNTFKIAPALFSLIWSDFRGLIEILTKIEILMCRGLPIRGVFLQNLAFDFLMALEQYAVIEAFSNVVTNKLSVIPGYITMNHSEAVKVLTSTIGLDNPFLCANYNVSGYRMNPSTDECEKSFASKKTRNIAMSVFASGLARSDDALAYVLAAMEKNNIEAILFGSTNEANIKKNAYKIFNSV